MEYLGMFASQNLPKGDWKQFWTNGFHVLYLLPNKVALCIYKDNTTEEFAVFEMDADFVMDPKHIEDFCSGILRFRKEILLPYQEPNSKHLQELINRYSDDQVTSAFPIDDSTSANLKKYSVGLYYSMNDNTYEISIGNRIPIAVKSNKVASKIFELITDEVKKVVGDLHNLNTKEG